ncbi:MAG: TIGR01212 family radical SAM protein [Chitinispirillales bacterium]|jgi:radical SAM protein (TIGR01212 family)|nr:TIGR01212 family radical SAM protein [Chitinispirillales bacterium]
MLEHKTIREFLKEKFGENVLKIPVNPGFSCPNKENGDTGCIFCDNNSFSPAALKTENVVSQFIEKRDKMKYKFNLFMPYLQPNTNTYAPVEKLREIYEPLIIQDGAVGLAIGTRPDAVSDETINYLSSINSKTYLSLELGLQSANNKTLALINRRHSAECFAETVKKLAEKNIEIVAHVMIGLMRETKEDVINTAKFISALPVKGVKIHQLMIIKNTPLEKLFAQNEVSVLTLEKYAEILKEFLRNLRQDIIIHRLMADSSVRNGLIAPFWSSEKNKSLNFIKNYLGKL